jgi:hypothetical protein
MSRVWVADTCALIEIRRVIRALDGKHITAQKKIFAELAKLVAKDELVYPVEVWGELKLGNDKLKDKTQDLIFKFADEHKDKAGRHVSAQTLKDLLGDRLARFVLDPDSEDDEADVYVLGVARELQKEKVDVGVLTQERRDLRHKLSVNTACGHLGIVCMPMPAFLQSYGFYTFYPPVA